MATGLMTNQTLSWLPTGVSPEMQAAYAQQQQVINQQRAIAAMRAAQQAARNQASPQVISGQGQPVQVSIQGTLSNNGSGSSGGGGSSVNYDQVNALAAAEAQRQLAAMQAAAQAAAYQNTGMAPQFIPIGPGGQGSETYEDDEYDDDPTLLERIQESPGMYILGGLTLLALVGGGIYLTRGRRR